MKFKVDSREILLSNYKVNHIQIRQKAGMYEFALNTHSGGFVGLYEAKAALEALAQLRELNYLVLIYEEDELQLQADAHRGGRAVAHDFTLVFKLPDAREDIDSLIDALCEGGCGDAFIGVGREGYMALDFTRKAKTLKLAKKRAKRDILKAIPDVTFEGGSDA